jgi:5-methylcytosine-specific restriction protein A
MKIDKRCFKIDKPNALAMIGGFGAVGHIRHQTIWVDVMKKPFPMLITLNRSPTHFQLSERGRSLHPDKYLMPLRYIAELDSEYFVRNDMELWKTICTNGLFNIWDPIAPYNRLAESRTDPSRFRIQLLRIYEIKEDFSSDDIVAVSSRIDHLVAPNPEVTIKNPVVNEEEFHHIKTLLIESVSKYRFDIKSRTSISQIKKDIDSLRFENESFEGEKKTRYSSYYERKAKLRFAAVRHHGTRCKICGFSFEETYGERGAGFIEVHHLTPVSQLKTSTKVNLINDITVVGQHRGRCSKLSISKKCIRRRS